MKNKCQKCKEDSNNGYLCVKHIDELNHISRIKRQKLHEELSKRGPIEDPLACDHVELHDDYCYDCDTVGDLVICWRCKEYTSTLDPCC